MSERQNKGNKLSLSTWLAKVAPDLVFQGGDWSSGRTRFKAASSQGCSSIPMHAVEAVSSAQTDEMVSVWEEGPGRASDA